ncbi:MAG: hypothetical protein ACYCWW_13885 [Deltaproteobacteria bacterium]
MSASLARAAEIGGLVAGATAEGRVQSDTLFGGGQNFVSVISPDLGYRLIGPTLDLSLHYDGDFYQYLGDTPRTDTNQGVTLHLTDKPSARAKVAADGSVQYVTDPLALDRLGVPRTTSPVIFSTAGTEWDQRLSQRWTAKLGYQLQVAHFEDPTLVDGEVHAPWVAAAYRLTNLDTLTLKLRSQLFLRVLAPNGSAQTPSLAWDRRLATHLQLELAAGPILYVDPTGAPGWTEYGAGGLVYTLHHGELELVGGRDLVGATGFGTAMWADYVQGGAVGRLSRRWSGRLVGTYFVDGLAPAQPAALSGYGGEVAVDFRPARDWTIEAAVDRIGQTGGGPGIPPAALDLALELAAVRVTWQWGSDKRLK